MSVANKHILIIEDEQSSIEVLQNLLDKHNISSYAITANPRTIEQELQNAQRPDAIFLDLEMPGINGYEVLGLIGTMAVFQDVPVVAYTTHLSHLNEANQAGFHSFLGKPLNRHKFIDQVTRILSGEPVWETP